jgi:hypothetical protein
MDKQEDNNIVWIEDIFTLNKTISIYCMSTFMFWSYKIAYYNTEANINNIFIISIKSILTVFIQYIS